MIKADYDHSWEGDYQASASSDLYMLFAGDTYDSGGGFSDFQSRHKTIDECLASLDECRNVIGGSFDWAHIIDSQSLKFVLELDYIKGAWVIDSDPEAKGG